MRSSAAMAMANAPTIRDSNRELIDTIKALVQAVHNNDQITNRLVASVDSMGDRISTLEGQVGCLISSRCVSQPEQQQTPGAMTPGAMSPVDRKRARLEDSPRFWGSKQSSSFVATRHITEAQRLFVIAMVKHLQKERTPDGLRPLYSVDKCLDEHIKPINPILYGNVDRKTIGNWEDTFKKRRAKESTAKEVCELDDNISSTLKTLSSINLLPSISIGMQICLNREYAVEAAKNPKGPQVSRSRVARLLKLLRMKSLATQLSEVKLTANEQEQLKSAFVTEILALRQEYYIPLSLMFNMDETAYQIAPPIPKNWRCSDGKPHADAEKYSRIFRRHPFTTLLCCVSASSEYLPPQINWKGKTDRLKVGHDKVQEYVQHTHWSTVESIFHYVETNLVPRVRLAEKDDRGRSPKFMLILDYYGVHVSAEFRRCFRERFGEYGMLVFVPPNMTSTLQPLDVAVFGPFKAQAKKLHVTGLVEGAFQHTFAKNPRAFEQPSAHETSRTTHHRTQFKDVRLLSRTTCPSCPNGKKYCFHKMTLCKYQLLSTRAWHFDLALSYKPFLIHSTHHPVICVVL